MRCCARREFTQCSQHTDPLKRSVGKINGFFFFLVIGFANASPFIKRASSRAVAAVNCCVTVSSAFPKHLPIVCTGFGKELVPLAPYYLPVAAAHVWIISHQRRGSWVAWMCSLERAALPTFFARRNKNDPPLGCDRTQQTLRAPNRARLGPLSRTDQGDASL